MLSFLFFAFVLSLDALGAGFTYGLKKIKFPFRSLFCFGMAAILCALTAVYLGNLLGILLPLWIGNLLSALILLILGIRMLDSSVKEYRGTVTKPEESHPLVWHLLGLTVTIMANPSKGDLNHSNTIDTGEAILLGIALSLDTFGVGISYGLSGNIWGFPLIVGGFHFLLLILGELLGHQCRKRFAQAEKVLSFLPGIILILFAVYHLLRIL